ncbi:uncharacterized protein PITG_07583 [Phytophthora infestans T30-4]|uniref:Uncharacterized protein n=1 Tax=Phytophthora infestans (strain T30-4) TaxID=403677 RepID=D0N8Q0_PHYIT|nr:uncharacterized protein PITG_07583 [Phytophthora infestans T30-4]EEY53935.1 conserved hypothetical protein [Phytophthora infestans T30-4]|eukprot:XP_002904566.1 conserved hypothetical protein [Phytophthora infestans T30-4]
MLWWYAHHGRLANAGSNWGALIRVDICINVHQVERMKAVESTGSITSDTSMKYWTTVNNSTSDIDEDNMRVHLTYFSMDAKTNDGLVLGGSTTSERAPYLASIGDGCLLLVWEGSSTSGDLDEKVTVGCMMIGDWYQALKTFPGGDVTYQSMGTTRSSAAKT